MGYAINPLGWRWVDSPAQIIAGETYSASAPAATVSLSQLAVEMLGAGVTVIVSGALNFTGTFATDVEARTDMLGTMAALDLLLHGFQFGHV